MISIIADIIGIASGIISILSYVENRKSQTLDTPRVQYNIQKKAASQPSISGPSLLDGEAVIVLWILGFLLCSYVYNNYRYWLMPIAATIVLLITVMVHFFFRSRHCVRSLPSTTFWVYIFSVIFTALSIACTAMLQQPSFGNTDLFHASQILSIVASTLVLAVLAWRMVSFSRGKAVNLSRLNAAVAANFISFLLASGLLDRFTEIFRIDF